MKVLFAILFISSLITVLLATVAGCAAPQPLPVVRAQPMPAAPPVPTTAPSPAPLTKLAAPIALPAVWLEPLEHQGQRIEPRLIFSVAPASVTLNGTPLDAQ